MAQELFPVAAIMAGLRRPQYICTFCGMPVPAEEVVWYANTKGGTRKYPKVSHTTCRREAKRLAYRARYSRTGTTRVLKADREAFAADGRKWCSKCQAARPLDHFSNCVTSSDGKTGWCRYCSASQAKQRRHERSGVPARVHVSLEDRVSYAKQGLKYCPSCQQAHPYEEFKNSPKAKARHEGRCYACQLAKNLGNGITGQAVRAKRDANDGTCDICGGRAVLVIDHDHSVYGDASLRGIICRTSCNLSLGYMKDSPELLSRLMAYLHKHALALRRSRRKKPRPQRRPVRKRMLALSEYAALQAAGHKWCPDCQAAYPISEFAGQTRLSSVCRMCLSARKKGPGVSGRAVRRLWAKRGTACNVCGRMDTLRLDHDHACKGDAGLRGILCIDCNSTLGRVKDSVRHIAHLQQYLLHWKKECARSISTSGEVS